jgi:2-polyprenyl-3-methyl-5-hydroxy-6-metoxy-1,4-benzoquinol methylase
VEEHASPRSTRTGAASDRQHRVCPWWLGYALASPVRRLFESPERLLGPYVSPGMTVVEPGCGMGFFSLPLARMVGPSGTVVCADLQPKMIAALLGRARRAGLSDRIQTAVCRTDDLGVAAWADRADLALAIHMVHEVPDVDSLMRQLYAVVRPGGRLLVVEPRGHVSAADFERTLARAAAAGFGVASPVNVRGLAAVVEKPAMSGTRS